MTPTIELPEFPEADFYDCGYAERLSHKSVEEALEEFVDGWLSPDCDVVKILHEDVGEVTVQCFKRGVIPEKVKEHLTKYMLDQLDEWYANEEYADPDGGGRNVAAMEAAVKPMRAAVDAYLGATEVWSCDQTATVTLTPEQVEVMLRAYCPEWFP